MILHGIDLVNITRFEFKDKNIYKKILNIKEYDDYLNCNFEDKSIMLAKLWAIKEALYKALPIKIPMNQMQIKKIDDQYSFNCLNYDFCISISYSDNFIIASVVGTKNTL